MDEPIKDDATSEPPPAGASESPSEKLMISEDLPIELDPYYKTDEPNDPIVLYDDQAEVVYKGDASKKRATIRFVWLPSPRIEINVEHCWANLFGQNPPNPPTVTLKDGSAPLRIIWTNMRISADKNTQPFSISGILEQPPSDNEGVDIHRLYFHIANGPSFIGSPIRDEAGKSFATARAKLNAPPWRVVLDMTSQMRGESAEKLKRSGGYGITHVGSIEREDASQFRMADVESLLDSIGWMLSFCRGARTFPLLLVGRNDRGEEVLTSWRCEDVAPMSCSTTTWFYEQSVEGFTILPRLRGRLEDGMWGEAVRHAMHWYLICNNPRDTSIEGAIVLQQAAFEVLAWTLLVEDRRVLSEDGAQKLPASDVLRLLLSHCGIQLPIPDGLGWLSAIAPKNIWPDGPSATTRIRNAIVHAKPKKQGVLTKSTDALPDAWQLGQTYLELVLLWLFDYQGKYVNRLRRGVRYDEAVENVPWVSGPAAKGS